MAVEEGDNASLATLQARGEQELTAYQNAAHARQYSAELQRVHQHEQTLGADARLPLNRAVARCLY